MRFNKYLNFVRTLTLFVVVMFTQFSNAHENEAEVIEKEINQIIQIAIDFAALQEYFHVSTASDRKPLVMKLPDSISSVSLDGVEKFELPIKLYSAETLNPYFEILNWQVSNKGIIFDAAYPVEGVEITYEFIKRDGVWYIDNAQLVEK